MQTSSPKADASPIRRSPAEQAAIMRAMTSIEEASLLAPSPAARAAAAPITGQYDDYWAETAFAVLEREEITPSTFDKVRRRLSIREFVLNAGWGLKQLGRQGSPLKSWWRRLRLSLAQRRQPGLTEVGYVELVGRAPRIEHGRRIVGTLGEAVDSAARMTLEAVAPLVDSDTLIVDLGSGWGRYSIAFCAAFPGIEVVSGELTASGRRSTALVAEKAKLPITSVPFDYYAHANIIDVVAASPRRNVVVFSSHSIEQVPYLDRTMFDDFLALEGKRVTFVHIEPVGWQIAGPANDADMSRPPNAAEGPYGGYNRNLFLIMLTLAGEGKVVIERAEPYYFAAINTRNTGALIVARSTRQA